jgi:hypothetical protein
VHRAVAAVTDEIAPVLFGAELDDPRTPDRVGWTPPASAVLCGCSRIGAVTPV